MADAKITALTENTTPVLTDIVPMVDDPGGTPATQKVTVANLVYVDGWIPGTGTWSYSSADDPTYVISINADVTAIIGVGDRIKITQTSVRYFIVTAVGSYSGGATLVTVYGGTDYDVANAGISSPYYSHAKSPFGFPLDPAKWTTTFSDTNIYTHATSTANTWYNAASFILPLGKWDVYFSLLAGPSASSAAAADQYNTLSTANNSESDSRFTMGMGDTITTLAAPALIELASTFVRLVQLSLAAKTTYYLNYKCTTAGGPTLRIVGSILPTVIQMQCAYL